MDMLIMAVNGRYRSFDVMWTERGHTAKAHADVSYFTMQCTELGPPFAVWNARRGEMNYLDIDDGYQEEFKEAWMLKTMETAVKQSGEQSLEEKGKGKGKEKPSEKTHALKRPASNNTAEVEPEQKKATPENEASPAGKKDVQYFITLVAQAGQVKEKFQQIKSRTDLILKSIEEDSDWKWVQTTPFLGELNKALTMLVAKSREDAFVNTFLIAERTRKKKGEELPSEELQKVLALKDPIDNLVIQVKHILAMQAANNAIMLAIKDLKKAFTS